MAAIGSIAGGGRVTPEMLAAAKAIAERTKPVLKPGARQAMADDPMTGLAQTLGTQATDTSAAAGGKYAALTGLARIGAGFLSKATSDENRGVYNKMSNLEGGTLDDAREAARNVSNGVPPPAPMTDMGEVQLPAQQAAALQAPPPPVPPPAPPVPPVAQAAPPPPVAAAAPPPPVAPPTAMPNPPVVPPLRGAPPPVPPAQAQAIAQTLNTTPGVEPPINPPLAPLPAQQRGQLPAPVAPQVGAGPARTGAQAPSPRSFQDNLPVTTQEDMTRASSYTRPTRAEARQAAVGGTITGSEDTDTLRGGTRAIDGNNTGGIMDGRFAKKQPGYVGSNGNFAAFDTLEHGMDAQKTLLKSYVDRGINTPAAIAAKWAPKGHGANDPVAYAKTVASQMGIGVNDKIGPESINKFAEYQARLETGGAAPKGIAGGATTDTVRGGDASVYGTTNVAIPDAPQGMPKAQRPNVREQTRSARMELVDQLLKRQTGLGAGFDSAMIDPYYDKGLDEENAARIEARRNQTDLDKSEFDAAQEGYYNSEGYRQQAGWQERQAARGEQYGRERDTTTFGRDLEKGRIGQGYDIEKLREEARLRKEDDERKFEYDKQLYKIKAGERAALNMGTKWGNEAYDKHQEGITAAQERVGLAERILTLSNEVDPGGVSNAGWSGQVKGLYNSSLAEMDKIQAQIVTKDLGGKLGGGVSNADLAFALKMRPIGRNAPVELVRRTAHEIVALSSRSSDYERATLDAKLNGESRTFTKTWDQYRNLNPIYDAKGNVRPYISYDEWLDAGKPGAKK